MSEQWMENTYFHFLPPELIDIIWRELHRLRLKDVHIDVISTYLSPRSILNNCVLNNRDFALANISETPALPIEYCRHGFIVYSMPPPGSPYQSHDLSLSTKHSIYRCEYGCILTNMEFIKYCNDHGVYESEDAYNYAIKNEKNVFELINLYYKGYNK